ncbi:hypothetical protein OWR29_00140 [Actinoplanes sp. Pm04-4]|uniref:Gram-positive cocci surface proteins LPxTG domain-containing protein n=1 Tax=Paractinoplanes pyxinae TaxID=2997416 RepID=A0ABT4AQ60_9ACTN|nr:hypothetical protein [Actinoplanes pyxinae]MCY1136389.1 hypothetical protein [Actinoplanes pyxinae]
MPPRRTPVDVGLRTAPNGWYGYTGVSAPVAGTRLTVTIPRQATIGGTVTATGRVVRTGRLCDRGPCPTVEEDDAGREVRLQERAGATAGWRTVATAKAGRDGTYTLGAPFAGTRDYRVVAPVVALAPGQVVPGRAARTYAETAATTTTGVTGAADGDSGPGGGLSGPGGGGSGGGLPITGVPALPFSLAGGLLVALGAALLLTGRRRRRPAPAVK